MKNKHLAKFLLISEFVIIYSTIKPRQIITFIFSTDKGTQHSRQIVLDKVWSY